MKSPHRPQLKKFLQNVQQPLFVLDNEAVMIFCNKYLADWTDCPAEQLVGQQLRYSGASSRLKYEIAAAALAPPPEVLQEKKRCRILLTIDRITAQSKRYAEYIPLEPGGVLVFIDGHDAPPYSPLTEPAQSAQQEAALELHQAVLSFRRRQAGRFHWEKIIGVSPAMQRNRRLARLAVEQNVSVLITGEPGTGKEHLASAIHYGQSCDPPGALVPGDCKVLDNELLAATVYAFQKQYRPEENQRHTLLLKDADAIPASLFPLFVDLTAAAQPHLRLIATSTLKPEHWTNHPAFPAVLGTVRIDLPPLRNRKEDVPVLAQMFLEENNKDIQKQHSGFTSEALDALCRYDWMGNVAELEQCVAAAHRSASSQLVSFSDLPLTVHYALDAASHPVKKERKIKLEQFLEEQERALLEKVLRRFHGNKAKAAEELGLTRPKLYRRLERFGLLTPE
ncbi:MAG: sigma 54-interacting transcriptional regulator [Planctomycetaceae bacterium]|jgi:transcriptional regulator with PAS, ATPase and Fis domain|nr:sigma 54-interacting transcriptional regulator [Planctomycetaceae bacterium]